MLEHDNNTMVCRCEDISLAYVRKVIEAGCRTIDEIKRITRAGMGPCQGRTCRMLIAQEISRYHNIPLEEVLMPTFRPLVKPIKMDSFVKSKEAGENGGGGQ
jgi:NAD(P)H-nitrite reductase large subunit